MKEQEHKKQRLSGETELAEDAAAAAAGNERSSSHGSRLVLVWDLDETLVIFNSLLIGTWAVAAQHPETTSKLAAVGRRWEASILGLSDSHFFFEQLEEWDQCCLTDMQRHDDGASLAGYDFQRDGFPPPFTDDQPGQPPRSPEQHSSAALPAPPPERAAGEGAGSDSLQVAGAGGVHAAAASAGANDSDPDAAQQGSAGVSPFGSPACNSLDAASLTKLAYRYRRISKLCSFGLQALGTEEQREKWEALYQETDALTGGWLSHASTLMSACSTQLGRKGGCGAGGGNDGEESGKEVVHVAVTSGQLIPSLAKLLLFKLNKHIAPEHVWSSRHCGKAACFERVQQRFGQDCTYVAIGDGMEEDEAAAHMGWAYVRVLLAPAGNYPVDRVLSWRPDDATGGPGLPLTQLTIHHIARAAGLPLRRPLESAEAAHGSSAAAQALALPLAVDA